MRTSLYVLALAVCASSAASAQVVLTEAEALARLSADSPRFRALRTQVELAQVDVVSAGRLPNPRVTVSREAVAGVAEDYALVAQPLPITGRRGFEIHAAEASLRATELRVGDLQRRTRAELRIAFAMLRRQQRREEELTSTLKSLHELADVLAKREQAGDAAGFDRLRAEREVLDLEADLVESQAARAQAQAALAGFFAPPVDPLTLRAVPETGTEKPLPSTEELIAGAQRSRGDLLALDQDAEAARLAQRAAERRVVPEPEVVAGVKTSNVGGGDRGGVVSVIATLPLFDRFRAERARAEVRRRQAQAELEVRRAQLRADIAAWHDIVSRRRATAQSYRKDAVGRADELRRIARVSYDEGERGILELLDVFRSASTAGLRLADLDALVTQAEIELEFLSGWESAR